MPAAPIPVDTLSSDPCPVLGKLVSPLAKSHCQLAVRLSAIPPRPGLGSGAVRHVFTRRIVRVKVCKQCRPNSSDKASEGTLFSQVRFCLVMVKPASNASQITWEGVKRLSEVLKKDSGNVCGKLSP